VRSRVSSLRRIGAVTFGEGRPAVGLRQAAATRSSTPERGGLEAVQREAVAWRPCSASSRPSRCGAELAGVGGRTPASPETEAGAGHRAVAQFQRGQRVDRPSRRNGRCTSDAAGVPSAGRWQGRQEEVGEEGVRRWGERRPGGGGRERGAREGGASPVSSESRRNSATPRHQIDLRYRTGSMRGKGVTKQAASPGRRAGD